MTGDTKSANSKTKYLFDNWQDELILAAADAVECCITSAYLNYGGVELLSRLSKRLATISTSAAGKSIKLLISSQFAPTAEDQTKIISRLMDLPNVEIRICGRDEFLHWKNYIFKTSEDIRIVIGSVNATSGGFFHNLECASLSIHKLDDPEVIRMQDKFAHLWDDAVPAQDIIKGGIQNMASLPKFQVGDNVRIISTGKIGTINKVLLSDDSVGYRVTIDGKVQAYQEKYLEAFIDEEQEIIDKLAMMAFRKGEDFRIFQTWFRLKRPIEGNIYAYLASRTVFNPYQFKPLMKFISPGSEERLFIADEVGVGKTIETGIILTELLARGRLDRRSNILIICPNALGPKWVKEMRLRFNLDFRILNGQDLSNITKAVLETGFLPEYAKWSVISLQLIRIDKHLEQLERISSLREAHLWSMVVIDEAHHMRNKTTDSNNVGAILSGLTEMLLMLSATPLNLKDEDLYQQMNILNPSMFPDLQTFNNMMQPIKLINRCRRLLVQNDPNNNQELVETIDELETTALGRVVISHPRIIALRKALLSSELLQYSDIADFDKSLISLSPLDQSFTRTLKREAFGHPIVREAIKVPVLLSQAEREFYDAVIKLVEDAYLAKGGDQRAIGFISNMPQRMVSSCIPAMREYLDWCLVNDQELVDDLLKQREDEAEDDIDLKRIPLMPEHRDQYAILRDQASLLGELDSKYAEFSILVKNLRGELENPQIMVFSFFVRTLKYLQKKLEMEGYRVGLICGEVPLETEGDQRGRYEIIDDFEKKTIDILLSSEVGGEGLDFQFCQAMINYDLPYNPMRVEQRIGRIDRFGQKAEKIFVASMFISDTIDERIYVALYDRIKLVENSIGALEPILGNVLSDLQKEIINGKLTAAQLEDRMKAIELAVEQAKLEMEQFESNRRGLMGDEYFTDPLHHLDEKSEFVRPSDATFLTSLCLNSWEKCSYESIDAERGSITLSKTVIAEIEQFTRRPGSEGSSSELRPLLEGGFPLPIVFNGSLADQYKDHHFLSPTGSWIRFLLHDLESKGKIHKVFYFASDHREIGLEEGYYLVPIFEVQLEGFRIELDLAAVPISLGSNAVKSLDFRKFSRLLGKNIMECDVPCPPDMADDLGQYLDNARVALEKQMDERVVLLQAENMYRIETRIISLERGRDSRISRFKQLIYDHQIRSAAEGKEPSQKYLNIVEGQMATEQRRTAEHIDKLSSKKNLSLTLSLVGVCLISVKG